MNDPVEWGKNVASLVKGYVARAADALNGRINALERQIAAIPVGAAGKDGTPGERGVDGANGKDGVNGAQGPAGPQGEKGEAGTPGMAGKDGIAGKDGERGEQGMQGEPGKDGADGAPGPKGEKGDTGAAGKDAEPITKAQLVEALKAMPEVLLEAVAEYLSANPPAPGKDGVNGRDGKDAEPINEEMIARAVASHIALNPPAAGRDGRDGLPGLPGAKGEDGKHGRDGLDLSNFSAELDPDGRTVLLTLKNGDRVEHAHLTFPVVIDRGVFRETGQESGAQYERGDGVTYGGSFWIAQKDSPTGKPGEPGADGWRLAVKRGRDGRDGAAGKDFSPPKPVKLP
jgi:integrin beta 3